MAGWWLALLAAPFAGSFLYLLVRRLPRENPELWGRSACEHCGHTLGPLELVPLVSYAALRGRCRACGAPIGRAHPLAEMAALTIAAAVVATGADGPELWAGCALGWTLLALAWIDWEHFFLPDVLALPLIVAGLAEAWWDAPWALTDRAIGAVAGYAGFRLLAAVYARVRKREGLGQGDAKLLAAGGAWLGWEALPDVILVAALCGLLLAIVQARGLRLDRATKLPFGPPLAGGIFVFWLIQAWLA